MQETGLSKWFRADTVLSTGNFAISSSTFPCVLVEIPCHIAFESRSIKIPLFGISCHRHSTKDGPDFEGFSEATFGAANSWQL